MAITESIVDLFVRGGPVMFVIAIVSLIAWFLSLRTWLVSGLILRKIQSRISEHNYSIADKTNNSLESSLTAQTARIGSSMNMIGTLANVLPLLGLSGTVLGMLVSFEVIQSYSGSQPQLLSGGISQALITTQAGLWTAVPVFFFHHIIQRKMRLIRDETEILFHELRQSRNNKFNITDKGELNISESYNV